MMEFDGPRMSREELLTHADNVRRRSRMLMDASLYGRARHELTTLMALLESSLRIADDDARHNEVATALADTYGMLGGAEVRDGNMEAAAAAYGKGCEIEQSERYGIVDSYNLTNSIVLRILLDPVKLENLREQLFRARTTVRNQVNGPRGRQWWAWADYGLLCLLSGEVD